MSDSKPRDAGSSKELGQIIGQERGPLLAVIQSIVRDQVEAEDVLQEVFADFIETYDLNVAIERVGAWLTTVAKNKIFDRFRRRRTRAHHAQRVKNENDEEQESQSQAFELERGWGLLRDEIVEALTLLPEEQLLVFVAHELEGKSFDEISKETGVGVNTLLSRKRYAVQFLREYLKEIYDELKS